MNFSFCMKNFNKKHSFVLALYNEVQQHFSLLSQQLKGIYFLSPATSAISNCEHILATCSPLRQDIVRFSTLRCMDQRWHEESSFFCGLSKVSCHQIYNHIELGSEKEISLKWTDKDLTIVPGGGKKERTFSPAQGLKPLTFISFLLEK